MPVRKQTQRGVRNLLLAVAAACFPLAVASAQEPWRFATDSRVVAFADVHGAYDELVALLRTTGVIDAELKWVGGEAHVVSLGDLIDRGGGSRAVLDLVMRLQGEAESAGGRLHVVLGNHEVMNLLADWRYVVGADYEAFAADETQSERGAAYEAYAAAAGGDSPATRAAFDGAYPRGYFARQAAFAPTGRYGRWLRTLPALIVVNDTAYVHGGLPRVVAEQGLEINERLHADLDRYFGLRDRLVAGGVLPAVDRRRDGEAARAAAPPVDPALREARDAFVAAADAVELGPDGPLWYRGSIYCKPILERPTLEAALARLGATRVVVGHTPTGDRRVRALYDGKLVALDTGMLADYFYGRSAALLVDRGAFEVQYVEPAVRGAVESGRALEYRRTAQDLGVALERGDIVEVQKGSSSEPWRVALRHDGADIGALFYPRGSDAGGDFELAAAAFDDLLGTDLVEPTVARTIEGQAGALQLRSPDGVSDRDRVARRLPFSGWCPIEPQLELMYTFDLLTLNRNRTGANVVFGNDVTDLMLIDNGRAFGTERAMPAGLERRGLEIPLGMREALVALDEQRLRAALGMWLDARRIEALLARRTQLLRGR